MNAPTLTRREQFTTARFGGLVLAFSLAPTETLAQAAGQAARLPGTSTRPVRRWRGGSRTGRRSVCSRPSR